MLRRVVSAAVGLAVGGVVYWIAGRYSPVAFGPLVIAGGAAVLSAMFASWFWRSWAAAGRVIAAAPVTEQPAEVGCDA